MLQCYPPSLYLSHYRPSSLSLRVFFFKHKTAYDVRISDWSSDVCSSDLELEAHGERGSVAGPDERGAELVDRHPHLLDRIEAERAQGRDSAGHEAQHPQQPGIGRHHDLQLRRVDRHGFLHGAQPSSGRTWKASESSVRPVISSTRETIAERLHMCRERPLADSSWPAEMSATIAEESRKVPPARTSLMGPEPPSPALP